MSDGATGPKQSDADRLAMNRRELLAVAGAIIGAIGLPGSATAAAITADQFHDLSVALTGFAPADRSLVSAFQEAFASDLDDLGRLYDVVRAAPRDSWKDAIDKAGLTSLAEALINAWYTGLVGEGANQRVVTYLEAFVWYAVAYTKPPSKCDTDFGAWATRPEGDY